MGKNASAPSARRSNVGAVCWQLWLTLAGALLELSGIALVVVDVREARAQAASVMRKDVTVRVPPAIAYAGGGSAKVITQETVEQRLVRMDA